MALVRTTRGLCALSRDIKKSVFISQSKDVYANLALEDWLYKNFDFSNHHVLMLWQNEPCVVVGRHQNPWQEASLPLEEGVQLARRNSGGGTVYHDLGNLNMTFFTDRGRYDRKYNLEVVKRALFREYALKVELGPREDLLLRNCKVSGTAAKLGRPNAYHHCTLLVNSNKVNISQSLQQTDLGIVTNATKSIKSKIINLCEEHPSIKIPHLFKTIGWEYLRTDPLAIKDGGMELANKQKGFHMINPTEKWFPGIQEIRDQFSSWAWRFGKTPRFTITRSFAVPNGFLAADGPVDLQVTMTVEQGCIADINLQLPGESNINVNVVTSLIGKRFTEEALQELAQALGGLVSERERFVTDCVRKVMCSV